MICLGAIGLAPMIYTRAIRPRGDEVGSKLDERRP